MLTTLLPWIAFFAITIVVGAVVYVLRALLSGRLSAIEQRLGTGTELPTLRLELKPSAPRGPTERFDRWFSELIAQAGIGLEPQAAFLLAVGSGLSVGGVLFLWRENPIVGTIGWIVGVMLVMFFFLYRRARRRRVIEEQLPEAIDLMARAVRAGESLDQAVETVASGISEPLAIEFRRMSGQLNMGLSVGAAIRAFTRRVPLAETRILAATLAVQRRTGGNLPITLERLATVCRDRLTYKRQHRVATVMARGSAALILGFTLLVVTYISIFRPSYTQQLMSRQGIVLVAIAVSLQVVGLIWIYRLLRTDY